MTGTVSDSHLQLEESDAVGFGGDFIAATFADFKAAEIALKRKATGSPTPQATSGRDATVVADIHQLQVAIQQYATGHNDKEVAGRNRTAR